MSSYSLNRGLQDGLAGQVLDALRRAEEVVGRQELPFPRIAVIGDESSGKSSMLESLCMIPFPRGNHTVTRCPTIVQLVKGPDAESSAIAWHAKQPDNKHEITSITSLDETISKLQAEMLGGESFSRDAVTVRVTHPDTADLTLIDLPGYFYYDGTGTEMGEFVKSLLMEYIMDANTIVLVIVPAIQEIKTVNIYNVLLEYERTLSEDEKKAFHARTIFCFTKVCLCNVFLFGLSISAFTLLWLLTFSSISLTHYFSVMEWMVSMVLREVPHLILQKSWKTEVFSQDSHMDGLQCPIEVTKELLISMNVTRRCVIMSATFLITQIRTIENI